MNLVTSFFIFTPKVSPVVTSMAASLFFFFFFFGLATRPMHCHQRTQRGSNVFFPPAFFFFFPFSYFLVGYSLPDFMLLFSASHSFSPFFFSFHSPLFIFFPPCFFPFSLSSLLSSSFPSSTLGVHTKNKNSFKWL